MTIILVLLILWVPAYFNARLWVWASTLIVLSVLLRFCPIATDFALYAVAAAAIIMTLISIPPLRRSLLSVPLFALFKRMLPPLSDTEREALEAGTVGWDGELFTGKPDWRKLLNLPPPALTAAEQAFLDGPVEKLCEMLDDWQIVEHDKDLSPEVWQFLKEERFFGMIIPPEYGGHGFSALAHSQVIMKIASRSITGAVTVMVPNYSDPRNFCSITEPRHKKIIICPVWLVVKKSPVSP